MWKWAAVLLSLAVACGSLGALGVGARALGWLVLSLGLMSGLAGLIAWVFLRKQTPP